MLAITEHRCKFGCSPSYNFNFNRVLSLLSFLSLASCCSVKLTFHSSLLKQEGCKAHFILNSNHMKYTIIRKITNTCWLHTNDYHITKLNQASNLFPYILGIKKKNFVYCELPKKGLLSICSIQCCVRSFHKMFTIGPCNFVTDWPLLAARS